MLFAFVCRSCGIDLTDFLSEVNSAALDPMNYGGAMLQPGKFVRIQTPISKQDFFRIYFASTQEGSELILMPGDFIVNVSDLRHQMLPRATFGCCGYQGGAESNACCPNGHPVATVHSDCWHAAFARLLGDSIECVSA